MKLNSLIISIILISSNILFSQDLITKKTGEDIKAKILEVGISEIKYQNFDNQDGPIYSLLKQEILIIRYKNGNKDIFNQEPLNNSSNSFDLYHQGENDAFKYYKGYKSAQTGTIVTSVLLTPLLGLVPAIATSSVEPDVSNLDYPSIELIKKPDYYNGYTSKAKKIKKQKVWTGWLFGLGIDIIAIFVINH